MYVHAYQSYVWNAIVSERIRTYGTEKAIVGDLVFESGSERQNLDNDQDEEFGESFSPLDGGVLFNGFV